MVRCSQRVVPSWVLGEQKKSDLNVFLTSSCVNNVLGEPESIIVLFETLLIFPVLGNGVLTSASTCDTTGSASSSELYNDWLVLCPMASTRLLVPLLVLLFPLVFVFLGRLYFFELCSASCARFLNFVRDCQN